MLCAIKLWVISGQWHSVEYNISQHRMQISNGSRWRPAYLCIFILLDIVYLMSVCFNMTLFLHDQSRLWSCSRSVGPGEIQKLAAAELCEWTGDDMSLGANFIIQHSVVFVTELPSIHVVVCVHVLRHCGPLSHESVWRHRGGGHTI